MWNIQQAADALQCRVASLSRTLFRLPFPLLTPLSLLPRAVCNYNETMHLPLVLPAALVLLAVVAAPVLLRAFCAGAVGRGLPSYRYLCCPDNYQLIAIRVGEGRGDEGRCRRGKAAQSAVDSAAATLSPINTHTHAHTHTESPKVNAKNFFMCKKPQIKSRAGVREQEGTKRERGEAKKRGKLYEK